MRIWLKSGTKLIFLFVKLLKNFTPEQVRLLCSNSVSQKSVAWTTMMIKNRDRKIREESNVLHPPAEKDKPLLSLSYVLFLQQKQSFTFSSDNSSLCNGL